jgi:hypothetical protein
MEFNEALELKNEIGETITIDNKVFRVLVSPMKDNDFENYYTDFRSNNFTDNSSKSYSEDNDFKVMALWTDGRNILFKSINDKKINK